MKLKRIAEDFQVEELTSYRECGGRFGLYRLSKQSLTTPEAVAAISRQWHLPRQRIAFGGLKDKYARTRQYLTIESGPRRNLEQQNLSLEYLGQGPRAYHSSDISGNHFQITVRDVIRDQADRGQQAIELLSRDGAPNYFDDQRFGSLGKSGEFIAAAWIGRRYEQACRLVLCDPIESDRASDREERVFIERHWGQWRDLDDVARNTSRSDRRAMIEYLTAHPTDFRRALVQTDPEQRSLYLAAFQSFLWNEIAAELLRRECPAESLTSLKLKAGEVVLYRELTDEVRTMLCDVQVPLPSARLAPTPGIVAAAMGDVLARLGLERRQLKVDYPRDSFFSKGERSLLVFPENMRCRADSDDLHAERVKLQLDFKLPRAAYATMIVKRLMLLIES